MDGDNHRVQVFSEQGEFLSKFGEQGSLDHQLQDPYSLSVDSEGNIRELKHQAFVIHGGEPEVRFRIFFLLRMSRGRRDLSRRPPKRLWPP